MSNPCANIVDPDALKKCVDLQNANETEFFANKTFFIAQINSTIEPREEAYNILNFSINSQIQLVAALQPCASSSMANIDIQNRLDEEDDLLEDIKDQFDDNQNFLDDLKSLKETIALSEESTEMIISFNTQSQVVDSTAAQSFLESVKLQNRDIQEKVSAELFSIQSSCSLLPPNTI